MNKYVPSILKSLGKVKNPNPNVDCNSGVILYHYNLKETNYYTVIFGVSRTIGCMTNMIIQRGLNFPLERPLSLDNNSIKSILSKSKK